MRTIVLSVRTFVLIFILFIPTKKFYAQSITTGNGKYEIGLGLGPSVFLGDLGGHHGTGKRLLKDWNWPVTKFAKGLFVNVYPVEWLGFRVALNQTVVEGYDSLISDKGGAETYRKVRNLEFKSNIWEAYAAVEVAPTVFFEQFDGLVGKLRPYALLGVGVFHFNPKGRYYPSGRVDVGPAQWVDLQPLRLEGQGMAEYPDRKQYKLTQLEIPMGVGFKYYLGENKFIGLELVERKTFTDYIDNVSIDYIDNNLFSKYLTPQQAAMANQLYFRENMVPGGGAGNRLNPQVGEQRGNPKQTDAWFSTILRFGWRLNDWNSPNGRAARQMRCPSFY